MSMEISSVPRRWIFRLSGLMAVSALGLLSISCTTTYDRYGRAQQSVDPGLAVAGVAAAGIIGYALASNNSHSDRRHRYQRSTYHHSNYHYNNYYRDDGCDTGYYHSGYGGGYYR